MNRLLWPVAVGAAAGVTYITLNPFAGLFVLAIVLGLGAQRGS